ncbi:hypothetical protein BSKO_13066 [Bryopsis sp. KO-2023]|nr:hypothetical protein BSKO_13066 [Bryopsis sp. KO-2023]
MENQENAEQRFATPVRDRSSKKKAKNKRSRGGETNPDAFQTPKRKRGMGMASEGLRRSARLSTPKKNTAGFSSPAGPVSPSPSMFKTPIPMKSKKKSRPSMRDSEGPKKTTPRPKSSQRRKGKFLKSIWQNGESFHVKQCAYVVLKTEELSKVEEKSEPCEKCGKSGGMKRGPLIECDRCLHGYHFKCLTPPLKEPPECEWICPVCERGETHPPRPPVTFREVFLQSDEVLVVCEIEKIWTDGKGGRHFSGTRFIRPEATLCGRQTSSGARELFRLEFSDEYEVERLVRPVSVLSFSQFENSDPDDDTFYCRFEYSFDRESFRRIEDLEDLPNDALLSSEDESDEYDPFEDTPSRVGGSSASRGLCSSVRRRQGGGDSVVARRLSSVRELDFLESPLKENSKAGAFDRAKSALTLSALPKCISCRDSEKQEISDFVDSFVKGGNGAGQCLYICGVPGTGKTATALEIIHGILDAQKIEKKKKDQLKFIEVNCFRLPSPQHLYAHLLKGLTGIELSPSAALPRLTQLFTDPKQTAIASRPPTLVLVDEMDAVVTKNQTVLYNLSEWCATKGSKLGVIGIANTLDLPERLHPRIKSRMGHQRMCFKPYAREQIVKIVKHRLEDIPPVFEELAIKIAAAKVSGVNGDVRRALELLRVSIDTYREDEDKEKGSLVMGRHVQASVTKMFQNPIKQILRNTSTLERIILAAMVQDARATGASESLLNEIVERTIALIGNSMGVASQVKEGVIVSKIVGMGERKLLICEGNRKRLWQKIGMNVCHDDVMDAVQKDATLGWLHRALGSRR